jgi:hypothetical protein
VPESVPVRAYQCPCRGVSRSRLFLYWTGGLAQSTFANKHNTQRHQKYMKLLMENPNTGIIKKAPVGFSWTTLFFSFFPALFRLDLKWFIIQFVLSWSVISGIVIAFIYNKIYIQNLLEKGFKVKDVKGGTLEDAKAKLGINLPKFETQS